ncbi:phosphonate ABC transporter, permease protein PhnE [Vagococcus elongatus]|uniref:Phosphonate ABC transporter, permease protein PhnE n=1 Tax=Vagococcus elongatus TaxID=180344 RepID=A0A430B5Y5_9ENTE|nr:phosphonate ABC transporter, permease protein PhnE [Vagococcus elongatus]RSU15715.1 phosphonate ABC transporter, permease protein PhnE [Vagococcus elongatus]
MNSSGHNPSVPLQQMSVIKRRLTYMMVLVFITFPFIYLKVNPLEILTAYPSIVSFFGENFFPPDFSGFKNYVPLIIETLLFAVVGTYISAILAFILGLAMSENINPIALVRWLVRTFSSLVRNIPVLVWASLLVYIFGIGSMVGLLALILATLGFLTRSYAETIDDIADTKLEALKANGASPIQVIVNGLMPEFIPSWVNWTLFSFEINIRASAILGMVGAGGIGIMIQTNIRLFKYQEALALIITLVILILLTEFAVTKIRKAIL